MLRGRGGGHDPPIRNNFFKEMITHYIDISRLPPFLQDVNERLP
jgi:hypothetical protein